jgi:hypothetical protein
MFLPSAFRGLSLKIPRWVCSIIIRQELDSVSGIIIVEERRFDPARYTTCGLASLRTWRRRKDSTSSLLPRWERWVQWVVVDPCNSKTIRGANTCHCDFERVSKQRKVRGPDSEQATNKNKRCTKLSNPIVRAKIYSKNDRPGAARKYRVLLYTITIVSGRPSVARSRPRSPVHQPLTDPQPQYSLNLNFLPISRLRALTVALSEGFVFPSSRTSPLAFKA